MTDTREAESRPATHPTDHAEYVLLLVFVAVLWLAVGIIIGWWFL